MNRLFVIGVLFLFVSSSVISISGIDTKQSIQPVSSGKTLYVGGSGSGNYTKIQDAINDSSDGDTVFVYDDSSPYYDGIKINKSITLIGEDKNTTLIIGDYPYAFTETILVTAENVNIMDLTIKHIGRGQVAGDSIILENGYCSISNCIISTNGVYCIGIYDKKSNHNKIANNTCEGAYGVFTQSDNNTIEYNEFIKCGLAGVDIRSSNNTVSWNTFSGSSFGIGFASKAHNNIVSRNLIIKGSVDVHDSHNSLIENSFYNGALGIYKGSNVLINNTVNNKPIKFVGGKSAMILDGGDYGQIIISDCTNITITHQNISNPYSWADISLVNCTDCRIVENELISDIGIYSTKYTLISKNNIVNSKSIGVAINGASHHNIISDNIIKSCHYCGISCDGFYNKIMNNTIVDNGIFGTFPLFGRFNDHCGILIHRNWKSSGESCKHNTISNNIIRSNKNTGISINGDPEDCFLLNTTVSGNIITGHVNGISLFSVYNNSFSNNHIKNNVFGIKLYKSYNNTVIANNFINNIRQATFTGKGYNVWNNNFWNRQRKLPKPIFGSIGLFLPTLITFDWHPAQEPYDIEV